MSNFHTSKARASSGSRVLWGSWSIKLQVSHSLSELSSVLHVHPANVVDDFFHHLDVLVRVSFSSCIIDEAFKQRLSPFKLRLVHPPCVVCTESVMPIIPATSSAGVVVVRGGQCCSAGLLFCCCGHPSTCRWLSTTIASSRHSSFLLC